MLKSVKAWPFTAQPACLEHSAKLDLIRVSQNALILLSLTPISRGLNVHMLEVFFVGYGSRASSAISKLPTSWPTSDCAVTRTGAHHDDRWVIQESEEDDATVLLAGEESGSTIARGGKDSVGV